MYGVCLQVTSVADESADLRLYFQRCFLRPFVVILLLLESFFGVFVVADEFLPILVIPIQVVVWDKTVESDAAANA